MKIFLSKILLYIIITSIVMFGTIQFLENSLKMGSYKKTQWVNKIKNKKFDVLFLGNSRVQNSIDVKSLTTVSEQSILNLGIDNSGIVEFNLMLNLFLDNNNSGEHLIIELDQGVLYEIEGKSKHLFTPFIKKYFNVNYYSNYINYFKFNFDLGFLNKVVSYPIIVAIQYNWRKGVLHQIKRTNKT